jgi:hypothetical protein
MQKTDNLILINLSRQIKETNRQTTKDREKNIRKLYFKTTQSQLNFSSSVYINVPPNNPFNLDQCR